MNINRIFALVCLLLSCGLVSYSQDTTKYTLDDIVQIAIENNHNIKIARNDLKIASNNATYSNAGLTPTISLSGNASLSNNDTKAEFTGGLPASDESGAKTTIYGGSIDVTRPLFDGFYSFNKYKKLKEQTNLSDIALKIEIENTIVKVSTAYFNLVSIDYDLQVAKSNFKISKERLEKINNDLEFGQSSESERLNALSAINADSLQINNLENLKKNAFADLFFSIGTDSISISQGFDFSTELIIIDYQQLQEQLQYNNLTLQRSMINYNISGLEYKMTKASYFPRLSLKTSYGYNNQDYDVGVMTLNQTLGFTIGATLTYDLFTFGKRKKDVQNSKIAIENQQLNIEKAELQMNQDFNKAWNDYQFQINSVSIEKSNVSIEEQRFIRAKNDYYLGQMNNLEFRDAQLSLARAKSNLVKTQINAKLAEMELLKLSGILLK